MPTPPLTPPPQDDSTEGYARQYAVVSLANEMAGGALAVSENKRPDYRECTKLLGMVDLLNKQMQDVMQGYIQMVGYGLL